MHPVYHPREDSFLLELLVRKHAQGHVLDMGTGTGYLAHVAAKKARVRDILAVDMNPAALEHAKTKKNNPKISYRKSDLFSNISDREQFDTIIFNPPYLPMDGYPHDPALIGGKYGYEVTCDFLRQAVKYLHKNGQILVIISTRAKPEVTRKLIDELLLEIKEDLDISFDFEKLHALRLIKNTLRRKLEYKGVKDITYAAQGKRGIVYKGTYKGKTVAIKSRNPDSKAEGRIKNEIKFLKKLTKLKIGPRFIGGTQDFFMREWAEGEQILDFIKNNPKTKIQTMLANLCKLCNALDRHHIIKEEMHHPWKHVIVADGGKTVHLVDFDRAKEGKTYKNTTQFLQMMRSLKTLLKPKKINIREREVLLLAKGYAKTHDPAPILSWLKGL